MKANRKRLKTILALGVKNFGPSFIASELIKFPLFDKLFLDLAEFQDLDIFLLFDFLDLDNFQDLNVFPDFLAYSIPFLPIPILSISPLSLFLLEADLLSSFLLEANLLSLFLLGAGLLNNLVVFNIEVSGAAILLKP